MLAAAIAGSALAVGTVHTVTLCIVTAALAVAAVLAWWGAEPMKARSAATLLLFTGSRESSLRQKPSLPRRLRSTCPRQQAKSTSALYLAIAGSAVTSRRPSAIA